jgi:hypothetical protein
MIMPIILNGFALDHVTNFLLKFINVECNLCYVYAGHGGRQECFIDLYMWASLFTDF